MSNGGGGNFQPQTGGMDPRYGKPPPVETGGMEPYYKPQGPQTGGLEPLPPWMSGAQAKPMAKPGMDTGGMDPYLSYQQRAMPTEQPQLFQPRNMLPGQGPTQQGGPQPYGQQPYGRTPPNQQMGRNPLPGGLGSFPGYQPTGGGYGAPSGGGGTNPLARNGPPMMPPRSTGGLTLPTANAPAATPAPTNPLASGGPLMMPPPATPAAPNAAPENPLARGGLLGAPAPSNLRQWNGRDAIDGLSGEGGLEFTYDGSGGQGQFSSAALGSDFGLGANMYLQDANGQTLFGDPNGTGFARGMGQLSNVNMTPGQKYRLMYKGREGATPFRISGNI